jgi:hypothetical protein
MTDVADVIGGVMTGLSPLSSSPAVNASASRRVLA